MLDLDNQDFRPRSRHQWALEVGLFLSRLAEIERQTHYIRLLANSTPEPYAATLSLAMLTKNWLNLTFEQRLDKLIDQINKTPKLTGCEPFLVAIRPLLEIRNVVSHGGFALKDGSTPERPNYCMWPYPEKSACDGGGDCPSRSNVVHIEQIEEAMNQEMHIISGLDNFIQALCAENGLDVNDPHEKLLSVEQRFAGADLQLAIGKLIVASGEIECMVVRIYQQILEPEYAGLSLSPVVKQIGYWLELSLKDKTDDLLKKLPDYAEYQFLRNVLREVLELIPSRNTLAHSMVRYEASPTGGVQLAAVRLERSGPKILSAAEVRARIIKSIQLSGDLSEAIAVVGFLLNRERRNSCSPASEGGSTIELLDGAPFQSLDSGAGYHHDQG
ncbi:Uncharacterized protein AC509_2034 [Pseudomonas amygdali pv. morsprunorum]|uniref:hypothetical protein n=1 Tax=Pseudomonas amygdali TaxID=47877 RepID=UPI0006B980C0|nr:hypothetical protein [Pseudomonas amygdali]KPC37887.1 Uncharacterized protein AC509_2034 [Pseudomonas amygdali pv. morsprunorum]